MNHGQDAVSLHLPQGLVLSVHYQEANNNIEDELRKQQSRKGKTEMKRIIILLTLLLAFTGSAFAGQPAYPVKVSDNGRYFVDQQDSPVFWLGTTQWQIFREYTREEARTTIESVRKNGFTFIQAMLMGVGDGTKPNVYGEKAWINDNPLTPN